VNVALAGARARGLFLAEVFRTRAGDWRGTRAPVRTRRLCPEGCEGSSTFGTIKSGASGATPSGIWVTSAAASAFVPALVAQTHARARAAGSAHKQIARQKRAAYQWTRPRPRHSPCHLPGRSSCGLGAPVHSAAHPKPPSSAAIATAGLFHIVKGLGPCRYGLGRPRGLLPAITARSPRGPEGIDARKGLPRPGQPLRWLAGLPP